MPLGESGRDTSYLNGMWVSSSQLWVDGSTRAAPGGATPGVAVDPNSDSSPDLFDAVERQVDLGNIWSDLEKPFCHLYHCHCRGSRTLIGEQTRHNAERQIQHLQIETTVER